jgi:DNA-binding XRE family transcriptional regulator
MGKVIVKKRRGTTQNDAEELGEEFYKKELRNKRYREYYSKNSGVINSRRKKRYREDPEYRKKAIKSATNWFKNNKKAKSKGSTRTVLIKSGQLSEDPTGSVSVTIPVFRVHEVAKLVGISSQTLRSWERKEWVPKPSIKGIHRVYTMDQVKLILHLKKKIDKVFNLDKEAVAKRVAIDIFDNWNNVS